MSNAAPMIAYWRASLADADRVSIDPKRVLQSPATRLANLAAGRLQPEIAAKLADQSSANRKARTAGADLLPVLLCPLVAHPDPSAGQNGRALRSAIFPLWVPALLAPNGELLPPEDLLPWIARELLEPTDSGSTVIGSVEELEHVLDSEPCPSQADGWQEYWSYCCRVFQHVSGSQVGAFNVEGYRTAADSAFVVSADTVQGSRQHIMRLYEHLLSGKAYPHLLQRYVARHDADLQPLLSEAAQRPFAARHLGQMGAKYSLSRSQREALHHFLSTGSGDILAVNGPPGTGKTTLIQSVVATLWAEAALRGGEPPVIVAASTNNQAVTNIIDSFANVGVEDGLLSQRWLPELSSFGLYCVSEYKQIDHRHKVLAIFPKSEREQIGFFAARETADYLARATSAFLDHCAQFFQRRPAGLEDAQALLQRRLGEVVEDLRGALGLWGKLGDVRDRIAAVLRSYGTLELALAHQRAQVQDAEATLQRLAQLAEGWNTLKAGRSFLDRFRRARLLQANQQYFAAHADLLQPPAMDDRTVEGALQAAREAARQHKDATDAQLRQLEADQQQLGALKQAWWEWCQSHGLTTDEAAVETFLDTRLRFQAFWLAAHYWEARWLGETRQMLQASRDERPSTERQMARWRRYAKLMPCFVSTLFMTPRFFSTWENRQYTPLYEFIDLLIIDEAGQVPSDVGGATFALAKRALVVGDTLQIEPVYQLVEQADAGNQRRHKVAVSAEEQAKLRAQGLSAVAGSLMVVAQRASAYRKLAPLRGMFLSEHQRCLPDIIAISNELAYQGALNPCRAAEGELPLPALGYAHIPGTAISARGSRENRVEAETIAGWLATQRTLLEQHYKKPLAELVGVITPFTRQVELLHQALRRVGIDKLTVGTVHSLQGAERRVIIFSPVYDKPGAFSSISR